MNTITRRLLIISLITIGNLQPAFSQAPCVTNTNGSSACDAEPLNVGTTCATSQEEMRTNSCNGTAPSASTCGLGTGTNRVWSRFTVAVAGSHTITWIASNSRDIRFGIYQYTNPCISAAGETQIACVNNGGNGVNETITLNLAVGQYWICGQSSGSLTSTSQMCVFSPNTNSITASDCNTAVNVCTNLQFSITPNGAGSNTAEIPPSGSLGNPYYDGSIANPWGSMNLGCLLTDEVNSTWMRVNIFSGGSLEFTFGGNGAQAGFYDWIMYPANANCTDISSNTTAPARCNWNSDLSGGTGLASILPPGGFAGNFEPPLLVNAGDVYIICFSNYSSATTSVPLQFGGTAIVDCLILPVEMISFKGANLNDEGSQLTWSTLSEKNNDYFDVEHSIDGISFTSIGSVNGAGNSTEVLNYTFLDKAPRLGKINYYRLQQVDENGEGHVSPIVAVNFNEINHIVIFPNPTSGKTEILLTKDVHWSQLRLIDAHGDVLHQEIITYEQYVLLLDLNEITSGIYTLEISNKKGEIEREKLIVF